MSLLPVFVSTPENASEGINNTINMLGGFEGNIPPCFDTDVADAIHGMREKLSKSFPDAINKKELVKIGDSQITANGHIVLNIEKVIVFKI